MLQRRLAFRGRGLTVRHASSGSRPTAGLKAIDVSKLKKPWTGLPTGAEFRAERSGEVDLAWLRKSPALVNRLRPMTHVPPTEEFWASSGEEGMRTIAANASYYELLALVSEHNWRHLVSDVLLAADAPLPHVVYEDLMRALTFSSKQEDPMKQFALEPSLLRSLLCRAAHLVLLDPDYFGRVEAFFRQIEQQQAAHSEAFSSFVLCCLAAGKTELALTMLGTMGSRNIAFDRTVFAMAMHPGLSVTDIMQGEYAGKARGLLELERIGSSFAARHEAAAAGVHAGFVLYSLSLQHAKKWELVREAIALEVALDDRTIRLIAEAYEREGGRYCGPNTHKALIIMFARDGRVDRAASVLLNLRMTEQRREMPALMRTAFTDDEATELYELCRVHSPRDAAAHMQLLQQLVEDADDAPAHPPNPPIGKRLMFEEETPARETFTDLSAAAAVGGADGTPLEEARPAGAAGAFPGEHDGTGFAASSKREASTGDDQSPSTSGTWQSAGYGEHVDESMVPHEPTPLAKRRKAKAARRKKKHSKQPKLPTDSAQGFGARTSAFSPAADLPDAALPVEPSKPNAAELHLRAAETAASPNDDDLVTNAFAEAAAARAATLAEVQSLRDRVGTAWMNPEAHFRS